MSYDVAFGSNTVDHFKLINYQKFVGPADPNDPFLNVVNVLVLVLVNGAVGGLSGAGRTHRSASL